ncbi:YbhB/YbcL family Raf kinase inhibitor-like protein [Actinospica sp.]|uniref:YbhB/YbcL family Raf kinase inhibitor-like protein n=1 Tax=Actinospica sp. TaxID=1872142 RepID=UPI002C9F4D1A|nr:YbhB/YbcL family Raf kinase inhibitor-like protein [Actinospica sp.]HWG24002.1 YbhB/YbcL family Raf kinase inhibitor-like protein [Actinospica sp.]
MRMKKSISRGAIALSVMVLGATAVAVATAGSATASPATASPAAKSARDGGYGFTPVRSGIPDSAVRFSVRSPEVHNGGTFSASEFADSFGCSGANKQFTLDWLGAPSSAKSYAVTMFDPDAPTGSGLWHWLVWDIPAGSTQLTSTLPSGAVAGIDSAGVTGYLGPCPPVGDITHHYKITVYALDAASLDLPSSTPPAITTFTMSSHVIGYAQMTVSAKR